MEIGKALRAERLSLKLTQEQMCNGIVSRPFYAKVESGKSRINAESLFKILAAHQIDFEDFFELIKDDFVAKDTVLQREMEYAVNTKNIELLEKYSKKILSSTNDEILKVRVLVTVAYFKNNLDFIDIKTRKNIRRFFNQEENWIKSTSLLRLLANTMPVWPQEELDFLMERLVDRIKKDEISEVMLEKYLRILGNYLVTCFDRNIFEKENNYVINVIDCIIKSTSEFHFMIYRINAIYMKAVFNKEIKEAEEIKNEMKKYGYGDVIANWPI